MAASAITSLPFINTLFCAIINPPLNSETLNGDYHVRALRSAESTTDALLRINACSRVITLGIQSCLVEFEDFLRACLYAETASLAQILVKSNFTFSHDEPPPLSQTR